MPKLVGTLLGTDVYEEPDAPAGQLYIISDEQFARIDARNRKQRIVDFIKRSYNQLMKKQLYVLSPVVVVLVCVSVAIIVSNDRKTHQPVSVSPQVKSLQAQLKAAQDTQKQHDAVNTTAIKDAGDQIVTLTSQKVALCTQIKAARLVQPLCQ